MREIKFRAYAADEEKMYDDVIVTGGLIHLRWSEAGYEFSNFVSDWSDYYNKNVYTVMQYTGLRDQEFTEVIESDIVQNERGNKYVVIEQFGCFGVEREQRISFTGDIQYAPVFVPLYHIIEDLVVIGNVFENKELLEGE